MNVFDFCLTIFLVWFLGALVIMFTGIVTELWRCDKESTAQMILWPLTLVVYVFIGIIWLIKHMWDTVILGFVSYLKRLPSILKEL